VLEEEGGRRTRRKRRRDGKRQAKHHQQFLDSKKLVLNFHLYETVRFPFKVR
jgi:hypothetical protein